MAVVTIPTSDPGAPNQGVDYLAAQIQTALNNLNTELTVLSAWVKARSFNLNADGATDDAAAVQAAIDSVEANGGGDLYIDYDNIAIASTLTIQKGVRLIGQGWGDDTASANGGNTRTSNLIWTGGATPMIEIKSATANNYLFGAAVVGLHLDGNNLATRAILASSVSHSEFDVSVRKVTTAGIEIDDGNGVLSQFNRVSLNFVYGSTAAVENAHGLLLNGEASNVGVTQTLVHSVDGLVDNGDMVRLAGNVDNNVFTKVHASVQSGGTGRSVALVNGASNHARNNLFGYVTGKVFADSSTYGNRVSHLNSEAGGVDITTGGELHYEVVDYVDGERWVTHAFVMNDEFFVPSGAIAVDLDFSGFATYDPPSLADGDTTTTTVTVTGAIVGDLVDGISFSNDLQGIIVTGYVSAADTVTAVFQNETGGTLDLASGTLRVKVSAHPTRIPHRGLVALQWDGIIFPDAITTGARANVIAPFNWNDGEITGLRLYFSSDTANTSDDFRIRVRAEAASPDTSVATPNVDESFTVAVNDAASRFNSQDITFASALAFTKGQFVGLRIDRVGGDAADTAAGELQLLGVALIYQGEGPDSSGSGTYDSTAPGA